MRRSSTRSPTIPSCPHVRELRLELPYEFEAENYAQILTEFTRLLAPFRRHEQEPARRCDIGGDHPGNDVIYDSRITMAELVAGLQAIPPGQAEAASALGLGYWRIMRLIVLPQAFRIIIPALVNLAIGFLLATSLLTVIGIFDLLNAAKASVTDPSWLGFYDEAYLMVALVYFAFDLAGSRYSQWLERRLKGSQRP